MNLCEFFFIFLYKRYTVFPLLDRGTNKVIRRPHEITLNLLPLMFTFGAIFLPFFFFFQSEHLNRLQSVTRRMEIFVSKPQLRKLAVPTKTTERPQCIGSEDGRGSGIRVSVLSVTDIQMRFIIKLCLFFDLFFCLCFYFLSDMAQ